METESESESESDSEWRDDAYARAYKRDPEFRRFMERVVASSEDGVNGHFQRMYTVDDAVAEKMMHENKRVENRFMWASKQPKNLAALLDKYVIIHKGVPDPRMLCVARLAEWGWAPDMLEWLQDHDRAQLEHAARGDDDTVLYFDHVVFFNEPLYVGGQQGLLRLAAEQRAGREFAFRYDGMYAAVTPVYRRALVAIYKMYVNDTLKSL
jgi:hypothetical protein